MEQNTQNYLYHLILNTFDESISDHDLKVNNKNARQQLQQLLQDIVSIKMIVDNINKEEEKIKEMNTGTIKEYQLPQQVQEERKQRQQQLQFLKQQIGMISLFVNRLEVPYDDSITKDIRNYMQSRNGEIVQQDQRLMVSDDLETKIGLLLLDLNYVMQIYKLSVPMFRKSMESYKQIINKLLQQQKLQDSQKDEENDRQKNRGIQTEADRMIQRIRVQVFMKPWFQEMSKQEQDFVFQKYKNENLKRYVKDIGKQFRNNRQKKL